MPVLKNISPLGDLQIPQLRVFVKAGEDFEVPDDVAGRPPSGVEGEDGYDLGEGLLAQTSNFALVKPVVSKASKSDEKGDA